MRAGRSRDSNHPLLKRHTERQLKGRLDKVMVTVPANFTDTGVQAVLSAARNAGMAIFQTDDQMIWREYRLDEPTAAAIDANGRNEGEVIPEKSVLVFDFGGGTLDVSVSWLSNNRIFGR